MFDYVGIAPLVIIALTLLFGVFIAMRALKKNFMSSRTYITKGWSKKTRRILQIDNEEIRQIYWKVEFWEVLRWTCISLSVGVLGVLAFLGELHLPLVILFAGMGAPTALVASIMRHKCWKEFCKLKEELGLEFEYDKQKIEEAKQKIHEDISHMKVLGIPFAFINIFVLIFLVFFSITNFAGENFRAGMLYAVVAVISIPNLIKSVKTFIAKRRLEK